MTGTKVASQRTLVIKPGMTPEDVKKAPNATLEQKAMAHIFDADGKDGFSQREAEVFNATSITNNGKNGVSLWTTYADGTKKETKVAGDLTAFKYAPSGDVKKIGNTENPVSKDKKISLNMTYQDAYKSGNLEALTKASSKDIKVLVSNMAMTARNFHQNVDFLHHYILVRNLKI